MRPALQHAVAAHNRLGKALWFELTTGVEIPELCGLAGKSARLMLESQAEQAARLGLRGLIDTSVPLTTQVAAEIARGE